MIPLDWLRDNRWWLLACVFCFVAALHVGYARGWNSAERWNATPTESSVELDLCRAGLSAHEARHRMDAALLDVIGPVGVRSAPGLYLMMEEAE